MKNCLSLILAVGAALSVIPAAASDPLPDRPALFSAFSGCTAPAVRGDESVLGYAYADLARPASAVRAVVVLAPGVDTLALADEWAIRARDPERRLRAHPLSTLDPPGVPVPRVVATRSGWLPLALAPARGFGEERRE